MINIAENTRLQISFGALGVVLTSIAGGAIWLSVIYYTSEANAKAIISIGQDMDVLHSIDRRLSKIEGYIEAKEN